MPVRHAALTTVVLIFSQCLPAAVFADRAATEKRGFNASGVFSTDFPDNISLFAGNFNLTVPIGPEYSVGKGLSYEIFTNAGTAIQ